MSKFETEKTLMYQYLVEDLEEQIKYGKQRVELLEVDNDFENSIAEQKQVMKWEEQLSHLQKYLVDEENTYSNRPTCIEILHFDNFGKKIRTEELNALQLDSDEYYYEATNIKLCDWKQLEEGKLYIIGNLTLKVVDGVLMSKYPQESMWYELNENFDSDERIFEAYGDKEIYFKN